MNDFRPTYRLSDMTAPSFAQAAASNPIILLPLGSHEDHGQHLPMGDYLLAETLAERIAKTATARGIKTFVAPCLPFGVADYFGSSPGGLAISAGSFRAVLSELLTGLLRHGLTNIIILNGHGGNVPVIHEVTLEIKQKENILIPSFYLWKAARQLMEKRLGSGAHGRFGHGAEPLLSLTMALRSDTVQSDAELLAVTPTMLGLPVSGFGTLEFLGLDIEVPVEFEQVRRDATAEAWKLASAAFGAEISDALVEAAAKFVVYFAGAAA
jgi:creatinine amidohydrolase